MANLRFRSVLYRFRSYARGQEAFVNRIEKSAFSNQNDWKRIRVGGALSLQTHVGKYKLVSVNGPITEIGKLKSLIFPAFPKTFSVD